MSSGEQSGLFPTAAWQDLPIASANLRLWRQWLDNPNAQQLYSQLTSSLKWEQPSLKIAGKVHPIPRLQAWYGDAEAVYRYSGTTFVPAPWTSELADLRERVEQACGVRFNSMLANWYRNGSEGMGFHADNEPELGPEPVIASVSLGEPRRFVLKPRKHLLAENREIVLAAGDLLEMSGATQSHWLHGIPKTKRPVGGRVNLTFRLIHPR